MSSNIRRGRRRASEPTEPPAENEAPTPEPPPVVTPPAAPSHTRLDLDDLEALARMDPSELASLMDGSVSRSRFEAGARVTGTISRIGRSHVFVDIGGKSEGAIELAEVPDAELGASLTAYVISTGEHGVRLSQQLAGAAAEAALEEAFASGEAIEGQVASRNRGGFEVRVGSVRAFCPISRISRVPAADPDALIGQVLKFRVIETGEKIVLDRRVIQEETNAVRAEELWASLEQGDRREGVVRNVRDFGAFVDVGGIDGLVPRSEIGWSRGADPREVLQPGQRLEVQVLEVDRDRKRLTLSCKTPESDPWRAVGASITSGSVHSGTVVKVEPFGAFVQILPGVTGLLHISRSGGDLPAVGDEISVRVSGVDTDRRRLELSSSNGSSADAQPVADGKGSTVEGAVVQVLRNGVALALDDGRSAWLPAAEVDLPAGTMLAQRYRRGRRVTATVKRVDGDRVILTARADSDDSQQAWQRHLTQRRQSKSSATGSGFGTLGDLLKGLKQD